VKKPASRQGDTSLCGQFVFRFVAQQLVVVSINATESGRLGQLLVACHNVDQHHPLIPSSERRGICS
jgi:hypothetical protein